MFLSHNLQSFVAELSDPNGGNIRNLTRSGRVATKADLSGVLARILHRRILHGVTGR